MKLRILPILTILCIFVVSVFVIAYADSFSTGNFDATMQNFKTRNYIYYSNNTSSSIYLEKLYQYTENYGGSGFVVNSIVFEVYEGDGTRDVYDYINLTGSDVINEGETSSFRYDFDETFYKRSSAVVVKSLAGISGLEGPQAGWTVYFEESSIESLGTE